MKVIVCGGRNFANHEGLYRALDSFHKQEEITLLIEGGARGADKFAGDWADNRGVDHITAWANWNGPAKRLAGPIRNSRMLALFNPEYVIAFPGGAGTEDMIMRATRQDVPVWKVSLNDFSAHRR